MTKEFSVNERQDEYQVTFRVRGTIHLEIKASSLEEAKEKARSMCEDENFGLELDEADEVDVDFVRKSPPMYRVTREGRKMQVSRLLSGDEPREPDERGF